MEEDAIRQALNEARYAEAEALAAKRLREHPAVAQNWVFLGEALLQRGYIGAAGDVFQRGALLDPQAQWIARAEKTIASRPIGPEREDIRLLLDGARVFHGKPITVAAAIMARNESRCIERCLSSLVEAVDEIVLIDYGSSDGTVAIASRFENVSIIHGEWDPDDFAANRNFVLPQLHSDWVFWMDADEWLSPEDKAAIREVAAIFHKSHEHVVLNISQVNIVQGRQVTEFGMPRLFPLHCGLRYRGRVHEQVAIEGRDSYDEAIYRQNVRIRVYHDGYEPERMAQKQTINRNLRLLAMMVEEEPDNPGWLLYYAREAMAGQEFENAKEALLKAESVALSKKGFGRTTQIYMLLFKIHMAERDYEAAEQACRAALMIQPDYPDASFHLAEAQLKRAAALIREAERHAAAAKDGFRSYRGVVSADEAIADWKADLMLADIALMKGSQSEAKAKYEALFARHPELAERRVKKRQPNADGQ